MLKLPEWLENLNCEVRCHHYTHRSVNALVSLKKTLTPIGHSVHVESTGLSQERLNNRADSKGNPSLVSNYVGDESFKQNHMRNRGKQSDCQLVPTVLKLLEAPCFPCVRSYLIFSSYQPVHNHNLDGLL